MEEKEKNLKSEKVLDSLSKIGYNRGKEGEKNLKSEKVLDSLSKISYNRGKENVNL